MNLDVALHIEHSSTINSKDGQDTSIQFGLADPDAGDEIVVDVYHDPIFNSFAFDTVAGITRCIHEDGTIAGEGTK